MTARQRACFRFGTGVVLSEQLHSVRVSTAKWPPSAHISPMGVRSIVGGIPVTCLQPSLLRYACSMCACEPQVQRPSLPISDSNMLALPDRVR